MVAVDDALGGEPWGLEEPVQAFAFEAVDAAGKGVVARRDHEPVGQGRGGA